MNRFIDKFSPSKLTEEEEFGEPPTLLDEVLRDSFEHEDNETETEPQTLFNGKY